jgi:hypothetical protein
MATRGSGRGGAAIGYLTRGERLEKGEPASIAMPSPFLRVLGSFVALTSVVGGSIEPPAPPRGRKQSDPRGSGWDCAVEEAV